MDQEATISDVRRRLAEAEAALRRAADLEAAFRRSEELRCIAVEGGGMGTWRWDLRDELIWGDTAFLSLWGFSPSDEPRQLADFSDRMSPQGQAEMSGMVARAVATEEEFDGQLAIVSGPTSGRWVRWRGRAERERPWIVNGVSFDVTDQRAQDEQLRESNTRHRLLIDSWAQAVWEADPHGIVVADSPSWRAYTGQSLDEWLGYGWLDAVHPDDRAYAERHWREAIAARELVNADFRLRAPDGEWRWTSVRAAPVLNAAGAVEKWAGMNIDIDARKRAELASSESEERYRSLFGAVSQGLAINRLVRDENDRVVDARFIDLNPAYEAQTGLSRTAAIGRLASEVFPQLEPFWLEMAGRVVANGRPERVEEFVAETGRWFTFDMAPFGPRNQFAVLYQDVTERKRAEVALRDSEQRFRALATTGAFSVYRMSPDWRLMYELDGGTLATTADPIEDWVEKYIPDEDLSAVRDAIGRAIRTKSMFELEHRVRLADGGIGWVLSRAVPLLDEQGEIVEWFGAGSDVTERREAGERLLASEARYHALFTASPVPFMVLAANPPDFTITAANDAYFAATLTTPETLIGRCLFDVFTDDPSRPGQLGSEALGTSLERVLETRQTDAMERVRYDLLTQDGGFEEHWWLAINAPLFDSDGNLTAIIHQVDRQTELHHAEVALRENEERQAFLLELSDALRPLSDPVAIQSAAMRVLGPAMQVSRAFYGDAQDDGDALLIGPGYNHGTSPLEGQVRFSDFEQDMAAWYSAGRTYVIEDTQHDTRFGAVTKAQFAAIDVGAAVGVPLVKDGRVRAIVSLHQTAPRQWTAAEIALVEEVAERTWAAVERARTEAALLQSEERLRQFGEASLDVLWIRDAAALQWQYLTPAFEVIYGLSREEALAGNNFRNWLDMIVDEDRELAVDAIRKVRSGESVTFDYRVRRPVDGAIRWLRNTDFPIANAAGEVVLIGGVGHDLTELRETELRLQALMEGIPQLVWRAFDGGRWTWASPQWTAFTGQEEPDSHDWGWLETLHPDDRGKACGAWQHAIERGGIEVEYRLCNATSGAYRWVQSRATPVRDEAGEIVEWLGTSTDIDDLRALQGRQQVMVQELQHRTRNLITVVGALSAQTMKSASSLGDFDQQFGHRLAALSRVQGLLSHLSAGKRIAFDELLRSELDALGAAEDRFTLDGPLGVPLRSATVQTFSLALHELATNALKYGALAVPDGHLFVSWSVSGAAGTEPRLQMDWRESGVALTQVVDRRSGGGYGRELIVRALPYQLGAETSYDITADGVHCTINVPISEVQPATDDRLEHSTA